MSVATKEELQAAYDEQSTEMLDELGSVLHRALRLAAKLKGRGVLADCTVDTIRATRDAIDELYVKR